jgi:hypothetical protein
MAALVLLAIIGYNYYNSTQSVKARIARMAETEALRASIPQPITETKKPDPVADVVVEPVADVGVELEPMPPEPEKEELNNNSSDSICESLIEMSENIMRNRLNGVPITSSLEAVNSIKDGTPANNAASNLAKQIVIEAYESPSFSTESYKDDAIREFGARQYLACIKAIR